ncbi:bifunctional folylpolyglutamate synthase/dihydrofolate synthase [Novosphingobium arvoryzae]|uniref:Bifunctional folylpolyglutamate synthase/dihydrofolate synthase n=1 Tax=Novosphingobium arvoryzae TaxID=1256514 RepID=A0A918RNM0_9SPHN|nr:folylpolyglutamate synthase/dihydrofolate synthase family protein [Novosphingobium arvoryzae]GHA04219.1 bifunctional folylpolyglutamate synthase/dihydrofolate synthase [Novosphingobium arvoryzae]
MRDFAISENPRVQAQLDRLGALSLPQGRIGLEVIHALLDRLGNPQAALPPVFHVAGTNGKGSTCAYLRAMLEAQGLTVHAATKPHLVRYNERLRIAGKLVDDELLADLLQEVLDLGADLAPSFFEVTTAATFLAFHRVPADVCVIEVGLGGRFDATNVLDGQAACGIATLGIDHEAFLLAPEEGVPTVPLCRIAFEKAGIARPGVPLVTQAYPADVTRTVIEHAMRVGAKTALRDLDWFAEVGDTIRYRDRQGELTLPLPTLAGTHQADNAALAVAMLRHQSQVTVSPEAMAAGIRAARWPARLQLLGEGPLTALAPGRKVWLDGGHNVDAGLAIARHFAGTAPFHLITGMLSSKDPAAIVAPLRGKLLSLSVVPAPGHEAHAPKDFAAHSDLPVRPFADVSAALAALPPEGDVLIAGSLYLAGEVLRLNAEFPD